MIDYALAVEYLMGAAEYGTASTYEDLERTWRDSRPIPTESELAIAWIIVYKKIKQDSVNEIREQRKYAPTIGYSGYTFDSDEESYRLVADATSMYIEDGITDLPQPWWDIDNIERLFTITELKGLRTTIAIRTQTVMVDAMTVKGNIKDATTIQEIDDIYNAYINE